MDAITEISSSVKSKLNAFAVPSPCEEIKFALITREVGPIFLFRSPCLVGMTTLSSLVS